MTQSTKKQQYSKYKLTHIDWIGEIPEDWGKWKISHLFKVDRWRVIDKTQISVDQNNDQIYPVFSSQTQNNWCLWYIETYDYDKDSITWTTDWANAGSVFYRQGKFNATNVCWILTMINKNQSYEYLTYCIRVAALNNRRVDILWYKLMSNEMASIRIPLPPLTEQQSIANYLDDKTTKIDEAISLKKNQIELLKEKRTAMINQAMTKWLDPNAEMIESGIEWIGKIPKGWEIKKLKRELKILTDFTANWSFADLAKNVNYLDDWYSRLVRLTDLRVNLENTGIYVDENAHNYLKKSELFWWEILIANVWAHAWFVCKMPKGKFKCTLWPNMYLLRFKDNIDNDFIYYSLISTYAHEQILLNATSTAQPKLNKDDVKDIIILVPKNVEQQRIVEYIGSKTSQIDQTITTVQHSIDLLLEYKQSLISHVVTGKVKVF